MTDAIARAVRATFACLPKIGASALFALVVSACAGAPANVTPVAPNAFANAIAVSRSAPGAAAAQQRLFVSDAGSNTIGIYTQTTHGLEKVGAIAKGVSAPDGLALGPGHELYVTNVQSSSVTVYDPPYSGGPAKTYTSGVTDPIHVAVGADGTVYISNYIQQYVAEYEPGHSAPSLRLPMPPDGAPQGLALAANGDLYVTYFNYFTQQSHVLRYAPGSTHGHDLGITIGLGLGIGFDGKGNLLLAEQQNGIDVFAPGATTPQRVYRMSNAYEFAFSSDFSRLYVGNSGNKSGVIVYAYPSGALLERITGLTNTGGVAVDPPAVP